LASSPPTTIVSPPDSQVTVTTDFETGTISAEISPTITPEIALIPTVLPTPVILPPTGPSDKILGLGIIGAIFTLIGGLLFMLL